MAAWAQHIDLVIGMVRRGQIDRVLALQDRARRMPDQGDGVPQARSEDRASFGPPAVSQIGVTPHLGRLGAVGAGARGRRARPAPVVHAAVAGRADIDQQRPLAVEDEAGQRVAVVVQPVVRQVADHGPHRRRRIGRVGVQRQDAVHLGHIDAAVRPARHGVGHGQTLGQPAPARRSVRCERQPPDRTSPGLPTAQVRDQPVAAGQGQQAARHSRPVRPVALPHQAQAIARRHPHRGHRPPAAVALRRIGSLGRARADGRGDQGQDQKEGAQHEVPSFSLSSSSGKPPQDAPLQSRCAQNQSPRRSTVVGRPNRSPRTGGVSRSCLAPSASTWPSRSITR